MRRSRFKSGRSTSALLLSAPMVTTGLLLTLARLMATTVPSILTAACLSAPVRGSTASMAEVSTGDPASGDGLDSAVLLRANLTADSTAIPDSAAAISTVVAQSAVVETFTVEAVVKSTAAVVFTVEEVPAVAVNSTAEAAGNRTIVPCFNPNGWRRSDASRFLFHALNSYARTTGLTIPMARRRVTSGRGRWGEAPSRTCQN